MKTKSIILITLGYFIYSGNCNAQDAKDIISKSNIATQSIESFTKADSTLKKIGEKLTGTAYTETQKTTDLKAASIQAKNSAIKSAREVRETLKLTTDLFNNTITTGTLFINVIKAMTLVTDEEAMKIDNLTVKSEKTYRSVRDILSVSALVASAGIIVADKSVNQNALIGINIASLGSIISSSIINKKERKKNSSTITSVNSSLKYIHDKVSRLSVHSFLVIKLKSVGNYMLELFKVNDQLNTDIKRLNVVDNWQDIEKLKENVQQAMVIISRVDQLYNVELSSLEKEIEARAGYDIYTADANASLDTLIHEISKTRNKWRDVRYFYSDVEVSLSKFLVKADKIIENAQYKPL